MVIKLGMFEKYHIFLLTSSSLELVLSGCMNHSTRILVTGATGNVGRHVVSQLEAGAGVRALTRKPGAGDLPVNVEIVQGDLTVPESIERHLDGVDAVFFLCRFQPGPNQSLSERKS